METRGTSQQPSIHTQPRRVPGGFGSDDDLSPTKPSFPQESHLAPYNNNLADQKPTTFDHASLPSLPAGNNSLMSTASDGNVDHEDSNIEHFDESAVTRHLLDVESSIGPVASPIGQTGQPGTDDTYLFDGKTAVTNHNGLDQESDEALNNENDGPVDQNGYSPPTPPQAYRTPAPVESDSPAEEEPTDVDPGGNTTSSLETMSSSPTAAAAARTVSRAISFASTGYHNAPSSPSASHHEDENAETPWKANNASTSESVQDSPSSPPSTIHRTDLQSDHNNLTVNAGSTPGAALLNRKVSQKRPYHLRSRYASQRSSVSSTTNPESLDDGSDITLGADYALQSGGALPTSGGLRSSSGMLSRSFSLGSMLSGIDDYNSSTDTTRPVDRNLATLNEEERNRERKGSDADEAGVDFETPRPNRNLTAPTDTVIAQHVRNVHVPESVAKEYRNQNRVQSPEKSGAGTNFSLGRNGKNLTLKEQSSTIERLSKENFDLKLKVMFLSDRLDKLSEEGVKVMISENVELKTGLAVMQRDNKALRRKVKDLENRLKSEDNRPGTAQSAVSSTDPTHGWYEQEDRDEELVYLRQRVEEYTIEIEILRNESMHREAEKRKLAEIVRNFGEPNGDSVEVRDEIEVWKDLLEQETARREQVDDENRTLRDEVSRLRTSATATSDRAMGHFHTNATYNTNKRRGLSPSRPASVFSAPTEDRNGNMSTSSTLVEELRRESDQLRHENAELRREVGAQTSMLTSRNREKERLYQEIEDLKLGHRRGGGSIAGDSIFERSVSRTNERSRSRASVATRQTGMSDLERDELENKNAELRDKVNAMKMQNQELQRELDSYVEEYEILAQAKSESESLALELQKDIEVTLNDLQTMQRERDETLESQEQQEHEFENWRTQAVDELTGLHDELDEKTNIMNNLQEDIDNQTENFEALQGEMHALSESVIRLEDDRERSVRRIEELEHEVQEANSELEALDKNLIEANTKINRLTVQQESSQGEVAFLREEQDGDKIKIGDLESAVRGKEEELYEEKERARDLERRIADERQQRELVAGREKQEVQKFINDLNREASGAKDEARRLRRSLTSREVEATEWKERLMELENNLREALGDLDGTRSSLLKSVEKLQRELENTLRELDGARGSIAEKDRTLKQRDALLESHGLESHKLSEMLEKERQLHRSTRHLLETQQTTQQHAVRVASQREARLAELESSRAHERRRLAGQEAALREQLGERDGLLLALWARLSALCGADWANNHRLVNGRALPSPDTLAAMFAGFRALLLQAVRAVEQLSASSRLQIRTVERILTKDYQELEHSMDIRSKQIERLEAAVAARSGVVAAAAAAAAHGANGGGGGSSSGGKAEIARLREANRALRSELAAAGARSSPRKVRGSEYDAAAAEPSSPSPTIPTGPRNRTMTTTSNDSVRVGSLTRHHSAASAVDSVARAFSSSSSAAANPSSALVGKRSGTAGSGDGASNTPPATTTTTTTAAAAAAAAASATNGGGNGTATAPPSSGGGGGGSAADVQLAFRLRQLEKQLDLEREGRRVDRTGAKRRLEEGERREQELRAQLERERARARGEAMAAAAS